MSVFLALGSLMATRVLLTPEPSPMSLLPISPLLSFPPLSPSPFLFPLSHLPHSFPRHPIIIHPARVWQGSVCVYVCACCQGPASACVQQRSLVRTTQGTLSLSNPLEIEQRCVVVCNNAMYSVPSMSYS